MTRIKKISLDEIDKKIISLMQENPSMTHSEIAERSGRRQVIDEG